MKILKIIWITICIGLIYLFTNKEERRLIKGDTTRWAEWKEIKSSLSFFINLFADCKEFRSVVYYRLRNRFRILPSIFLKGQISCYICSRQTDAGLILIHGYSTIVNTESIGKNCTIFQNVTIGYSKGSVPTIGNNCVIGCGSIILGDIHVGNNVIVAAGTVVRECVPDNSLVIGNPGKIYPRKFDDDILEYV